MPCDVPLCRQHVNAAGNTSMCFVLIFHLLHIIQRQSEWLCLGKSVTAGRRSPYGNQYPLLYRGPYKHCMFVHLDGGCDAPLTELWPEACIERERGRWIHIDLWHPQWNSGTFKSTAVFTTTGHFRKICESIHIVFYVSYNKNSSIDFMNLHRPFVFCFVQNSFMKVQFFERRIPSCVKYESWFCVDVKRLAFHVDENIVLMWF